MTWTGVGNVEARFVRAAAGDGRRHDSPVVLGGVVGFNLPQVRRQHPLARAGRRGGDGDRRRDRGLLRVARPRRSAQDLAERVLERHGKGTDDALAVVVRYLGPPFH